MKSALYSIFIIGLLVFGLGGAHIIKSFFPTDYLFAGETAEFLGTVYSREKDRDYDNLQVRVISLNYGLLYASSSFDLGAGDQKTIRPFFRYPAYAHGPDYVMMTVRGDDGVYSNKIISVYVI